MKCSECEKRIWFWQKAWKLFPYDYIADHYDCYNEKDRGYICFGLIYWGIFKK